MDTTEPVAIYVHIPFCRAKCLYCDFNSCAGREADIPTYVGVLLSEMEAAGRLGLRGRTLYVGGGTPSLLAPGQLAAIVDAARRAFSLPDGAEVSLEANPGTVDAPYLRQVREAGFSRLSLGVQSLDDARLAFLGRIHTAAEARAAVVAARAAGFDNLNLDFIYGLPGQSAADWRREVASAVALQPEHLSLYALTVEDSTPLGAMVAAGEVVPASADEAATMYEDADDLLAAARFEHYEVSNYARTVPGGSSKRCRHNLAYWTDEPYLGFGAGAHSYAGGSRYWNESDPRNYVARILAAGVAEAGREAIDGARGAADALMLGLRLAEGVDLHAVGARYGLDVAGRCAGAVEELEATGLAVRKGNRVALTRRGRLLENEVLLQLLPLVQAV